MWAGKDNGEDVDWQAAMTYCQDLRLAGHSDWRLPTIGELEGLYDPTANARGVVRDRHPDEPTTLHVKGNLFLTGREWSSTQTSDVGGSPDRFAWYFDFSMNYKRSANGRFHDYDQRALCVRGTPSAAGASSPPQAAHPPASWVDPSTGLTWAGKDNGKDITWKDAATYCSDLRLDGHSDWRLPTIEELAGIGDRTARSAGLGAGKRRDEPLDQHVKGNLFLTGHEWSSTRVIDDRGNLRDAWVFEFVGGARLQSGDEAGNGLRYRQGKRALCVRGAPAAPQVSDPSRAPAYWVDRSTGLMWAGKDNGEDVTWRAAMTYCQDLRLGGYSDWRLATIEELEGIHDQTAKSPGGAGRHGEKPFLWPVKGNLFLTGEEWSGTQKMDSRGRPTGRVWYMGFESKFIWSKSESDRDYSRALCVRRPGP